MTVVALWSAKGSPGVTTAVAALAAGWPEDRELLVIEADASGGDLALWLDRPAEPGLVSLAAAGRRGVGPELLDAHTQPLRPEGARSALLGPVSGEQAHAALTVLRGSLLAAARRDQRDVLVDCGRLDPSSPSLAVLGAADRTVAVCRPRVADVHHLATRVAALQLGGVGSLLTIGDRPYGTVEVAEATGLLPFAVLPHDDRAAQALAGDHPAGDRLLRRSSLLRSARDVAVALVGGEVAR